jgi:hypothetical protein
MLGRVARRTGTPARLVAADMEGLISAGRHEPTGERLNDRNGVFDRMLDTRLGAPHPEAAAPGQMRPAFPGLNRPVLAGGSNP